MWHSTGSLCPTDMRKRPRSRAQRMPVLQSSSQPPHAAHACCQLLQPQLTGSHRQGQRVAHRLCRRKLPQQAVPGLQQLLPAHCLLRTHDHTNDRHLQARQPVHSPMQRAPDAQAATALQHAAAAAEPSLLASLCVRHAATAAAAAVAARACRRCQLNTAGEGRQAGRLPAQDPAACSSTPEHHRHAMRKGRNGRNITAAQHAMSIPQHWQQELPKQAGREPCRVPRCASPPA